MAGNSVLSDEEDEVEVEEEEEEDVEGGDGRYGGEDDDEEDEDGQDEYDKDDGFLVDDVDEEEDRADSDDERHKKKKRKKRESEKNYELDEDDYELLQDNNAGFSHPKLGSKKFKRLKKARTDTEGEHSEFSDDEIFDKNGRGGQTGEEKTKHSLFDEDGGQFEDIAEDEAPQEGEDEVDDDEMADFIVDEDDVYEDGEPVRRKVNKKKSRQAPGVSSSALQEAQDIFGDVDELLRLRKMELDRKSGKHDESGDRKERRLEDEFEPTILSEKYMTEKDDRIREIDIPERIQISEKSTGSPPDKTSINEESNWILNQLGTGTGLLFGKRGVETTGEGPEQSIHKDDIVRFLEFMHLQKLDVPFIVMYRKEECPSLFKDPQQLENEEDNGNTSDEKPTLRWHKVLWAILELDRKWLLLQKRKSALQLNYNNRLLEERNNYDETQCKLSQELFESITKSLKVAESEKEVDDVDSKFNLHFPPGDANNEEGQYKRPKRKSQYSVCTKAGLWEVAGKFGYSSEQFGLQISLANMRMDELEDAKETPDDIASRFKCKMFETPQAVLKGARHMAAVEISCEPCVRKYVRSIFMDNAVVSTSPTPDGNVAIKNPFHGFATIKWLRDKPLTKFEDAQWLLIQKAEEEKLIQVTIKLPESVLDKLMDDSKDYYLSDGVSKHAQLWNEQRKLILHDAFYAFLLPSMEKEARSLLTSRAKNWLLIDYGRLLWDKVSVAPYQKKNNDVNSTDDYEGAPRVMACCWGPGNPATTFVMLDSSGEVIDVLYAGCLSIRGQSVHDQQRKKNDQQRVVKFMTDHQPHVVVLGAVNLACKRLKEDIYEIIFKMVEDNPRDEGHEMDGLSIVYGDESLPHLYENSRISSDQLPTHPGIVKRAVALGRYLQNPLAMSASLCGPGREILSWKLSSLEKFLTPDEKYGMIEQVMVDVTNQVGLDINLATSHEWLFAPFQFISGLGPRKAASLQRSLVKTGAIFTRKDLLSHGLGKKVFVNAVGFLRVRRSGLAANSNQYIDLLDDTRIHPESYKLAQEMAIIAYKEDTQEDIIDEDDFLETAIEHFRVKSDILKTLEVDAYAKDNEHENKIITLNLIRLELMQGFQDWRRPFVEPSPDEEFCMISGETEDTLAVGRIVQATVRRVQPQRAICALDSGLTGMLNKEDYSDDRRDNDLTEKLNEGDILTCKVKNIQKNRYQIFLSCKDSEMRNDQSQNQQTSDPYYHEDPSNLQSDQERARKEKERAKKKFKSRMIVHPRFQNITADEAMEFLAEKECGESIIRPCSRGPTFLTLTLKIYDGVYAHKDIIEGGKEHKDITSLLRLRKTLKIGEDTFEDLDEVMDRYVDPLVVHLKTMLSYRKFKKGTKAEVDELLKIDKMENPTRIMYSFGIFHEHPGIFILTYIRSSNPHHEYIGLYPKGFKFRKKMFDNIDRLVAYFQRHIDDPLDSAPSIRSVAAMVPMRSPGGASGGWVDASNGDEGGLGGQSVDLDRTSTPRGAMVPMRSPGGGSGGWGGGGSNSNEGGWRGQSVDRDRTSTPRGGRGNNRNGGGQDGHPSGVPRPYGGRGRGGGGRGRGKGGDGMQDSVYSGPKWDPKDCGGEGWGSFPGAKVQNSPGREAFPGGWGGSDSGGGGGGWGDDKGGDGGGGWGDDNGGDGWGNVGGVNSSGVGDEDDARYSGWGGSKKSGAW